MHQDTRKQQALERMNVRPDTLEAAKLAQLDDQGYVALPDVLTVVEVSQVLDMLDEGQDEDRAGGAPATGTLHRDDLLGRCPPIDRVWTEPRILAAVHHLLGPDFYLRGLSYRAPLPGYGQQGLHADWPAAPERGSYQVCSALIALSPFTAVNGSTRLIPGSHRWGRVPGRGDLERRFVEEARLTGPAGTAFVFNGHLWHSGTRNEGTAPRHSLLLTFARRGGQRGFEGISFVQPSMTAPMEWITATDACSLGAVACSHEE